ncbi:MAG: hypothetical protein HKN23_10045 [Verrucomicrobiales bacterium]|nr:hypothetical protein [Verrucomicrobiales bacterium]
MNFVCPTCSITLQAEPELAGKTVKCPGCSTKIQIPELEEPTQEAEHEEHSAGEEIADDYYDSLPELNMNAVEHGPHPSKINFLIALGLGVVATFMFCVIIGMFPSKPENGDHTALTYIRSFFLERSWVQYATTFLMFFCLAILVLKLLNIRKQRRAMLIQALPTDIDTEITPQNLKAFHDNLLNFPKPLRNTYIVNRIRKSLEFFYVRQNNPEVAQMISSQSDVDANKAASSYSLVKVLLWAIPIMGFIGTVMGIGQAIGQFDKVLNPAGGEGAGDLSALTESLSPVLAQMGVAFDTTLLALVFSIILSFPASGLQSQEEDLVSDVDEYCIDNLLKRLNDGGAASNFGSDAGLLKAIGDAMASNQKDVMSKFASVQKGMSESLNNQTKQYEKVATAVEAQLSAIGERAEKYESRLDEDFFQSLEKIRTESVSAITSQVNGLSEGIQNLNSVLADLNGKQVVVKKKGWFGRS